jgi:hypothetical protein
MDAEMIGRPFFFPPARFTGVVDTKETRIVLFGNLGEG